MTRTQTHSPLDRIAAQCEAILNRTESTAYTLVAVVDAEVPIPADRRARRDALRDLLWDAVIAGTYSDFDAALAAYAIAGEAAVVLQFPQIDLAADGSHDCFYTARTDDEGRAVCPLDGYVVAAAL